MTCRQKLPDSYSAINCRVGSRRLSSPSSSDNPLRSPWPMSSSRVLTFSMVKGLSKPRKRSQEPVASRKTHSPFFRRRHGFHHKKGSCGLLPLSDAGLDEKVGCRVAECAGRCPFLVAGGGVDTFLEGEEGLDFQKHFPSASQLALMSAPGGEE